MNDTTKVALKKIENDIKFVPRLIFAKDPISGDKYRFRFNALDRSGQLQMGRALSDKGLSVKLYGGFLRPQWHINPFGKIQPEPVPTVDSCFTVVFETVCELLSDFFETVFNGRM